MTIATFVDLRNGKAARATAGAVGSGTPSETVAAIRDLLDDKRLSWALWPHGRPG
ncbi:hypothetical protein [Sandarakinorhabdus sp. DWP1-3-1]|uniref:hypothetical protein n=1 Tax=Sandarakinorhabdus sp. DWP1-3-1 TaxID=2804627 RepID=UPI003CF609BC